MISWNRFSVIMVLCVVCAAFAMLLTGVSVQGDDEPAQIDRADAKVVALQGKGRQASNKFNLEPGLGVFEITHDGDTNFIVKLLDENGKSVDTLFNQIGPFKGERGFSIPAGGQYLLDVVADGNWSAKISQPRPTQANTAPRTLQGTGYGMTPFVHLEKGLNVFKLSHNGKNRFSVTLTDRDGHVVESLINTLGKFDGSNPVSIDKPGIYFLNVSGDGDWTIEVQ